MSRIGTVYMRYNSFALSQVGGLRIVYNRRGQIVDIIGDVKGYSYQNGPRSPHNYYGNTDYDNGSAYNNGDDYYYYKADGTKAKMEDKLIEDKTEDKVNTKK